METNLERAVKMLQKHLIKPSYQRVKVLDYLLCNDTHPTADIIYKDVIKEVPTISKATVYNTLNLFLSKNIVSVMSTDKFESRYDLVTEEHGHFVCDKCQKIYNFPFKWQENCLGLEGFKVDSEDIVLKGTCSECLNKNNELQK